jgi:hypothetical protein
MAILALKLSYCIKNIQQQKNFFLALAQSNQTVSN